MSSQNQNTKQYTKVAYRVRFRHILHIRKIINHHNERGTRESDPIVQDLQHPRLDKPRRGLQISNTLMGVPRPSLNEVIDYIILNLDWHWHEVTSPSDIHTCSARSLYVMRIEFPFIYQVGWKWKNYEYLLDILPLFQMMRHIRCVRIEWYTEWTNFSRKSYPRAKFLQYPQLVNVVVDCKSLTLGWDFLVPPSMWC